MCRVGVDENLRGCLTLVLTIVVTLWNWNDVTSCMVVTCDQCFFHGEFLPCTDKKRQNWNVLSQMPGCYVKNSSKKPRKTLVFKGMLSLFNCPQESVTTFKLRSDYENQTAGIVKVFYSKPPSLTIVQIYIIFTSFCSNVFTMY